MCCFRARIAERGDTAKVIENPQHPYVQQLIELHPCARPGCALGHRSEVADRRRDAHQRNQWLPLLPALPVQMDRCLTTASHRFTQLSRSTRPHVICMMDNRFKPSSVQFVEKPYEAN